MKKMGATPENIAAQLAKLPVQAPAPKIEMGIDDEGPAIGLFCALHTQWKTAGMTGVRTGLDYNAIKPTADLLQISLTPRVFLDLQIMENEQLLIDNERALVK